MESEPGNKSIIPSPSGGLIQEIIRQIKLVWLLLSDKRVNIFLKTLPILSLAYLVIPFDLAPGLALPIIGALDDAAIVWIGTSLFVGLCPPEIVEEHMESLKNIIDTTWKDIPGKDVVDAEARDVNDQQET
ncbi:YkvA family protein [Chloroflexota bacterium]